MSTRRISFYLSGIIIGLLTTTIFGNDVLLYPQEPELPLTLKVFYILNSRVAEVPPQKGGRKGHCYPLRRGCALPNLRVS